MFDKYPILNAESRILHCNNLCYYIAKLHFELGALYESTIYYWAMLISNSYYPPEGFKSILNESDWTYLIHRYNLSVSDTPADEWMRDYWSHKGPLN